jgi:DNA-binding transcriptional ArsR family regulator
MADQDFDTLLRFFKALANENRLRMVGILVERECGVEELATLLDLQAPTVSHHLSKLKELGVVKMRRERNDHLYRLDLDGLHQLSKQVFASFESEHVANLVDDVPYEAWEKKVLDVFVEGEAIQAMPTGYKKRLVVLKWLADHFEQDRRYTEREVNEIIEHHHEDYCMLRREMVDGGLMNRENGVYWRLDWEMLAFES